MSAHVKIGICFEICGKQNVENKHIECNVFDLADGLLESILMTRVLIIISY